MIKEVRFDIGCENLEKMLEFYKKLGAKEMSREDDFIALEIGNVKFDLWKAEEDQQGVGLTFVSDDYEKEKALLKNEKTVIEEWEDCNMVLFEDPDTNAMSLLGE